MQRAEEQIDDRTRAGSERLSLTCRHPEADTFVERRLRCATDESVRALETLARVWVLTTEQNKRPSTPPLGSAVIVKMTLLRSTSRPSKSSES